MPCAARTDAADTIGRAWPRPRRYCANAVQQRRCCRARGALTVVPTESSNHGGTQTYVPVVQWARCVCASVCARMPGEWSARASDRAHVYMLGRCVFVGGGKGLSLSSLSPLSVSQALFLSSCFFRVWLLASCCTFSALSSLLIRFVVSSNGPHGTCRRWEQGCIGR